ncbi:hypothetical protein GCM10007231_05670 [Nocardioides daphniae]|uniref:Uncharacterized protein n=1 Tax=Nocardioides daphniae TaxID=402297 RepID=A0ABQ1Q1D7_9ACTN|nr:hypothetical protein GCM10007231_05670 [Nocardioides daphniae]
MCSVALRVPESSSPPQAESVRASVRAAADVRTKLRMEVSSIDVTGTLDATQSEVTEGASTGASTEAPEKWKARPLLTGDTTTTGREETYANGGSQHNLSARVSPNEGCPPGLSGW